MASDILRELKVILRLEDKATPDLKKKSGELSKVAKDMQSPLQELFNLKNAILGGALAGLATFILNASDKFEKLGRAVEKAGFRFGSTGKQTQDLTFAIKEMGKESVFSTDQLAQALSLISQTGLDTAGALQTLQAAMDLASATGLELGNATQVLNALMQAFNIDASQAAEVAVALANAARLSGIDIGTLSSALLQMAPAAEAAGVDFNELLSAITLSSQIFDTPTTAIYAIKTALEAMAFPASQAANLLRQLVPDIKLQDVSLIEVLEQINDRVKDLSDEEIGTLFDPLIKQARVLGDTNLVNFLEDLRKRAQEINDGTLGNIAGDLGTVAEEAEKVKKGLTDLVPKDTLTAMEYLQKQIDDLILTIGSGFGRLRFDPLKATVTAAERGTGILAEHFGPTPIIGPSLEKFGRSLQELADKNVREIDEGIAKWGEGLKQNETGVQQATQSLEEFKNATDQATSGSGLKEFKEKTDLASGSIEELIQKSKGVAEKFSQLNSSLESLIGAQNSIVTEAQRLANELKNVSFNTNQTLYTQYSNRKR